ncbi:hypothetical protein MMC14_008935 [Varicellaria rhodocarpa]|nr:hypothetical protein [Varicellaria rhodocarpa]
MWWHNISFCQDSAVTLARHKVADSKLSQLARSLDETTGKEALVQSGFLRYAPQLFVSKHPLVKSPSLARALFKVLQMQFDGDVSSEDLNVFTFCLATILLSRPYVDRASSLYSFSNTWALSPAKGLQEWLERVSRTRRNHAHSRQLDLAKCLNHQPLFANLVVGFFSLAPEFLDDDTYLPMRNIRFKTDSENGDGRIGLHASDGSYDGGPFRLEGILEVATGTLNMTMTHAGEESYVLSGMMTPFGLAGQIEEPSGYFWLWKASWRR